MGYEEQYREWITTILTKGKWIFNERTGKRCLTIPKYLLEYQLTPTTAPLLQGRPSYPVSAWAELLGYFRRYTWAYEFDAIGSKNWYENANKTQGWLDNPNRIGTDHLGEVYGAALSEEYIQSVFDKISKGIDDRGLKFDWWQPESFERAALRPCLSDHQITFVGNEVSLVSNQRSCDVMCGGNYNSLQVYMLGMMACHLSGKTGGTAWHVLNNCHIYESHLEGVEEYLARKIEPINTSVKVKGWVEYPEDITKQDCHGREYFYIDGYKDVAQPKINFELIA